MTRTEKKNCLGCYLRRKENLTGLQEELAELRTQAESCTALLTGLPGGSAAQDRLARQVEKLTEQQDHIAEQVEKLVALRLRTEETICTLEQPRLRRLLRLLYLGGETMENAAVKLSFSERQIYRLHSAALEALPDPLFADWPV